MEQQQFDAQAVRARVNAVAKELRQSELSPAIMGGVAGGIAGALMAVIVIGIFAPKRGSSAPSPAAEMAVPKASRFASFSVQDVVKLVGIVMTLMKQAQAWSKSQEKK